MTERTVYSTAGWTVLEQTEDRWPAAYAVKRPNGSTVAFFADERMARLFASQCVLDLHWKALDVTNPESEFRLTHSAKMADKLMGEAS